MLVTELAASIDEWKRARTGRPHLVILHAKGSHYQYSKRYPRGFSRWQPECREAASRCTPAELLNAYDNSLDYTDHVLHSALEVLRDEKAFLSYVSDHGESIEDDLHYHGTPTAVAPKELLSVPFMLWLSDAWLSEPANRSRFERLRSQAGRLGRAPRGDLRFPARLQRHRLAQWRAAPGTELVSLTLRPCRSRGAYFMT